VLEAVFAGRSVLLSLVLHVLCRAPWLGMPSLIAGQLDRKGPKTSFPGPSSVSLACFSRRVFNSADFSCFPPPHTNVSVFLLPFADFPSPSTSSDAARSETRHGPPPSVAFFLIATFSSFTKMRHNPLRMTLVFLLPTLYPVNGTCQ